MTHNSLVYLVNEPASVWVDPTRKNLYSSDAAGYLQHKKKRWSEVLQAKAWRVFLTSKFFYIQDGIWKWHCFDAETWREEKMDIHYYINRKNCVHMCKPHMIRVNV